MDFEEQIERLERIIRRIDVVGVDLDEFVPLYKEAAEILRRCDLRLTEIEKRLHESCRR